jgi:peptidoglycan/LPS O-acetylase OafA/YrhL
VLWATTDGVAGGFLELSPMLWIGRLAYGIYLWHMPAPRLLEEIGVGAPDNDGAAFVLLASCSVLAAKLSWDLVEKPINDVKSRYPYHPRSCDPAPGSIDATVDTDPVRLS